MRKKSIRFAAFLLALTLSFSLFSLLPVGAAEAQEYFVFDALQTAQGNEYAAKDEPIILPLDGEAAFSAVGLSLLTGNTNALYISLVNHSNATKIRVSYTYELYGVTATESAEHALLAPSAGKQALILEAPHIGEGNSVKELSISFHGEQSLTGDVLLNAIFNISTYVQDLEAEASFSRCHYNAETGKIDIQGSLSYAATVRYEGETLALFSLAQGEDLHLSSKTPIARANISFNFSFSVEANNSDALFSRYVVAAVTAKGERIPLCVPTYPSFPAARISREQGFKGIQGTALSGMIDAIPDVGVVDVYLNRLLSAQSDGILYAGEYDYYYFDQAYLTDLDTQIKNLTGIGSHVYLRLLVDGQSTGLSFVDEAPADVQYRLPVIRNEQAQRDLFALIDFLSARYATGNKISGLILGHAADLVQEYSYCAADHLGDYATLYAATLNLVVGAARRNLPTLQVMLPISDRVFPESMTALSQTDDYYGALLLPSLLSALEAQVLEPQTFALMLESQALSDLVGGEDESVYGTDRIQNFLTELQTAAQKSPYLQTSIFFSWRAVANATQSELRADYLIKYATLYQNGAIGAFLLDLAGKGTNDENAKALVHMAKYVNTDRYNDFCAPALEAIGLSGITALYPSLQVASFQQRRIGSAILKTNGYASVSQIAGGYAFWDFSAATDALGWYAGNGCTSISVTSKENETESHALRALCSANGDYAEISYHFTSPTDLSFAPLLCTELAVLGAPSTRYELQLRLIGDQTMTYASTVVTAGESQKLYLDLSLTPVALSTLRNVRVMVRPLDTKSADFELSLSKITLESASLSSTALAERINKIQQNATPEQPDNTAERDYTLAMMITGALLLISVAIVAIFILAYRAKRKKQNLTKKENYKE